MAKQKDYPNLPASSKMQMPSGGGNLSGLVKETGGMSGSKGGASKKMTSGASGKGMAGKNPYC